MSWPPISAARDRSLGRNRLVDAALLIGAGIGSMILAVVAFIGALGAMPVSMVLRRLGARRALIFGLVAIGIGRAIDAAASGAAVLIVSRASTAWACSQPCLSFPIFCSRPSRHATTAAVAADVIGNIIAGILLRAGIPIWTNVAHFGWPAVPLVMIPGACVGLAVTAGIRNAGAHVECFQSR